MSTQEQDRVSSAEEVRDRLVECLKPLIDQEKVADVWKGDTELAFSESVGEEVAALAPLEMLGGFYHSMGLTITGGSVLHRYQ